MYKDSRGQNYTDQIKKSTEMTEQIDNVENHEKFANAELIHNMQYMDNHFVNFEYQTISKTSITKYICLTKCHFLKAQRVCISTEIFNI